MEASYPVDRVTRFAGTNKLFVYGTQLLGTHMFNTLYLHEVPQSSGKGAKFHANFKWKEKTTHALLAKVSPGLPSFPGKAFTWENIH